MLMLAATGTYL